MFDFGSEGYCYVVGIGYYKVYGYEQVNCLEVGLWLLEDYQQVQKDSQNFREYYECLLGDVFVLEGNGNFEKVYEYQRQVEDKCVYCSCEDGVYYCEDFIEDIDEFYYDV